MMVRIEKTDRVVRVVRKHKPRNGGGVTLAEFTDRDGKGWDRAVEYAAEKRHTLRD